MEYETEHHDTAGENTEDESKSVMMSTTFIFQITVESATEALKYIKDETEKME